MFRKTMIILHTNDLDPDTFGNNANKTVLDSLLSIFIFTAIVPFYLSFLSS